MTTHHHPGVAHHPGEFTGLLVYDDVYIDAHDPAV